MGFQKHGPHNNLLYTVAALGAACAENWGGGGGGGGLGECRHVPQERLCIGFVSSCEGHP